MRLPHLPVQSTAEDTNSYVEEIKAPIEKLEDEMLTPQQVYDKTKAQKKIDMVTELEGHKPSVMVGKAK